MTGSGHRPSPITFSPASLHHIFDRYAQQCCPVLDVFAQPYHWSFMQVEYATDLVFCSQTVLKPLYEQLSRQAIMTVKAEHVATFAPDPRHQTRHRHLSLLSHPRRPCCYRGRPPPH
jgi:hypothetical protein